MKTRYKIGLGLLGLLAAGIYAGNKILESGYPKMSKEEKEWRDAEEAYSQREMELDADAWYEDPDLDHSQYM